jgi:hypothetical protein
VQQALVLSAVQNLYHLSVVFELVCLALWGAPTEKRICVGDGQIQMCSGSLAALRRIISQRATSTAQVVQRCVPILLFESSKSPNIKVKTFPSLFAGCILNRGKMTINV